MALCRKLDLFGRELLAVDGTRLMAVNSQTLNFTCAKLETYLKSADERLERYRTQLEDIDRGKDYGSTRPVEALAAKVAKVRERRQVSEAMLDQLKASGENQISLTNPDLRTMVPAVRDGRVSRPAPALPRSHELPSGRRRRAADHRPRPH